ncbi:Protein of unknown function [Pseudosulfitobacter pseudonitzschiae]|uniref:DUF3168 domain-containing protein n=1 Tax=Pseudosulfitobacter pseudonitzschiae TaxID=1402135 RepID=A0A073J6K1_9RHOB|nr:DUF3168 domain-containing protein [Pseudosulfitobacter pseudonitzschiae]KEJ97430.1 hypothetical protein SUH3_00155 [Pseudosulfitobacter pseudonitzschiae]QKS08721.1 DUF3168 domain-containing protein [Pseudosulfitobacter pseudonitzschiae]SHE71168.1 Protein of unknown function [Pseudosulfitobacter pseudonitzschiae]
MEELIRALLKADVTVMARANGNVNFGSHPQGTPWPGVVLYTVGDAGSYTLQGSSGLSKARVQANCIAPSYSAAKQLSRAVRDALSGHASAGLQGVFHVGTRDGREGGTNEATRPHLVSLDFIVTYNN